MLTNIAISFMQYNHYLCPGNSFIRVLCFIWYRFETLLISLSLSLSLSLSPSLSLSVSLCPFATMISKGVCFSASEASESVYMREMVKKCQKVVKVDVYIHKPVNKHTPLHLNHVTYLSTSFINVPNPCKVNDTALDKWCSSWFKDLIWPLNPMWLLLNETILLSAHRRWYKRSCMVELNECSVMISVRIKREKILC